MAQPLFINPLSFCKKSNSQANSVSKAGMTLSSPHHPHHPNNDDGDDTPTKWPISSQECLIIQKRDQHKQK